MLVLLTPLVSSWVGNAESLLSSVYAGLLPWGWRRGHFRTRTSLGLICLSLVQ